MQKTEINLEKLKSGKHITFKEAWKVVTTPESWISFKPLKTKYKVWSNNKYAEQCEQLGRLHPLFQAKLKYGDEVQGDKNFEDFFVAYIKQYKLFSEKNSRELSELVTEKFSSISMHNLLSESEFVEYLLDHSNAQEKLLRFSNKLVEIILGVTADVYSAQLIKIFLSKDSPLFKSIVKNASERELKDLLEKYPHLPYYHQFNNKILAVIESLDVSAIKKMHLQMGLLNKVLAEDSVMDEIDVLQAIKILKVDIDDIFKFFILKLQGWLKNHVEKLMALFSNNECSEELLKKIISNFSQENTQILFNCIKVNLKGIGPIPLVKLLRIKNASITNGLCEVLSEKENRPHLINILKTSHCDDLIVNLFFVAINNFLNDNEFIVKEFINDQQLFELFLKSEHSFIKQAFLTACSRYDVIAQKTLMYIVNHLPALTYSNQFSFKKTCVALLKIMLLNEQYHHFIGTDGLISLFGVDEQIDKIILMDVRFIGKIEQSVENSYFLEIVRPHFITILNYLGEGVCVDILKSTKLSLLQNHLRLATLNLFKHQEPPVALLCKLFKHNFLRETLFTYCESNELYVLANSGDEKVLDIIFSEDYSKSNPVIFDHFLLASLKNIQNFSFAEKILKNEFHCKKSSQFLKIEDLEQVLTHSAKMNDSKFMALLLEKIDSTKLNHLFNNNKEKLQELCVNNPQFREQIIKHPNFQTVATWLQQQQIKLKKQLHSSLLLTNSTPFLEKPTQPKRQTITVPAMHPPVVDESEHKAVVEKTTTLPVIDEIKPVSSENREIISTDECAPPPPPPPGPPPPPPPSFSSDLTKSNRNATKNFDLLSQLSGIKLKQSNKEDKVGEEENTPKSNPLLAELRKKQAAKKTENAPTNKVFENNSLKNKAGSNSNFPKVQLRSAGNRRTGEMDSINQAANKQTSLPVLRKNPSAISVTENKAPDNTGGRFGQHLLRKTNSTVKDLPPNTTSNLLSK